MLKYIDSHCHLQHTIESVFFLDRLNQLCDNLAYVIDISTNTDEILNLVSLLYQNPAAPRQIPGNFLFAFGQYPDRAEKYNSRADQDFKKIIEKYKPSAIGEVGLDYYWNYGDKFLQEKLFRNQIEVSIDMNLPLIVHSRNSFQDTHRILSSYQFKKHVIIHCFGYGPKEAEELLKLGFFISFAGNLTYRKSDDIRNAALLSPIRSILLETDSPYLSPVPVRGQKNNPENVKYTYQFLCRLKEIDEEVLVKQVEQNFKDIFIINR